MVNSMLVRSALLGLVTFLATPSAFAASDVKVSIPAPASQYVYSPTSYGIKVQNIGNAKAYNVALTVTLPLTHTSPQVYVMGTLSAIDSRCVKSNNKLVCQLGTISANKSTTVTFNIALPVADEVLSISAAATTTSSENSTSNNSASNTPTLVNYSTVIPGGSLVTNQHCTGTGLTSYFECTLFPSSISAHDTILNGDGSITVIDDPINYSGAWSQPSSNQLNFQYFENGQLIADFEGFGSEPGCFEGITIFVGSTYLAPYEVCL